MNGNVIEIDLIAVNEKENKILIVECKWENNVSAKKLLMLSQEKVKSMSLFKKYSIYYVFFAKSFKEPTNENNVRLFDLKQIEKIL